MLTLKAPAKINWTLKVLNRRPDGFHEISSLIEAVSLYDTLRISPSETLELITDMAGPVEENLVMRAARLLLKEASAVLGAKVELEKKIPSPGGLGGGSSDAAAVLKGLNDFWGLSLSLDTLYSLSSSIGSDVPFFIKSGCALAAGRGELLCPVTAVRTFELLLAVAPITVPTAEAYGRLNRGEECRWPDAGEFQMRFIRDLNEGNLSAYRDVTLNDFEPGLLKGHKEAREVKAALYEAGAELVSLSGSGPAFFGVFPSDKDVLKAREFIDTKLPDVRTCAVRSLS